MSRQVSNSPYLITTTPSLTTCRRVVDHRTGRMCNRKVLAVTVGGLDRHVDTATLNDTGELAALLEGRSTYLLTAQDYLVRRTATAIRSAPPKRPVLADHTCREVPDHHVEHAWTLAALALLSSALGVTVTGTGDADQPPF